LKTNHVPIRKCIACNTKSVKSTFIRIVRTTKKNDKDKNFLIDSNDDGRGFYICRGLNCIEKARKKKKIERIFSSKNVGNIYENLKKAVCRSEK
jgi:predicted RNA-binding protein YlxR (DUF448 family)